MNGTILFAFKSIATDGSKAKTQVRIDENGNYVIERILLEPNGENLEPCTEILKQFSTHRLVVQAMGFKTDSIKTIAFELIRYIKFEDTIKQK